MTFCGCLPPPTDNVVLCCLDVSPVPKHAVSVAYWHALVLFQMTTESNRASLWTVCVAAVNRSLQRRRPLPDTLLDAALLRRWRHNASSTSVIVILRKTRVVETPTSNKSPPRVCVGQYKQFCVSGGVSGTWTWNTNSFSARGVERVV
jgi:hypothetical protein